MTYIPTAYTLVKAGGKLSHTESWARPTFTSCGKHRTATIAGQRDLPREVALLRTSCQTCRRKLLDDAKQA